MKNILKVVRLDDEHVGVVMNNIHYVRLLKELPTCSLWDALCVQLTKTTLYPDAPGYSGTALREWIANELSKLE